MSRRAANPASPLNAGRLVWAANVTTRKHVRFIQRHAPYPVRRLFGGSVVPATHLSRTLWLLYADAL